MNEEYGLFSLDNIKSAKTSSPQLSNRLSCIACGLYKGVKSPKIPPWGQFGKYLMVLGEGPGEREDAVGKPWQGKVGQRLQSELRSLGIDLYRDAISLNSVNCRPPRNRTPTGREMDCCWVEKVNPALLEYKPNVILLLGGSAVATVIGRRVVGDNGSIGKWRGWTIPDPVYRAWLCPTFHPSYIEREEQRPEIATIWRQDLERAVSALDAPIPDCPYTESSIRLLLDEDTICSVLHRITKGEEGKWLAFDYETTGLKPHAPGHRIVCIAVTTAAATYAFPYPNSERGQRAWRRLLSSPIRKIAHNMKFEIMWSNVIVGVDPVNWGWDGVLAAHVLDNRPAVTGLKFQSYVNFGIVGYNAAIEPYLKGTDSKNGNSHNRIEEFIRKYGIEPALRYCGMDSMLNFALAMRQMDKLEE